MIKEMLKRAFQIFVNLDTSPNSKDVMHVHITAPINSPKYAHLETNELFVIYHTLPEFFIQVKRVFGNAKYRSCCTSQGCTQILQECVRLRILLYRSRPLALSIYEPSQQEKSIQFTSDLISTCYQNKVGSVSHLQ